MGITSSSMLSVIPAVLTWPLWIPCWVIRTGMASFGRVASELVRDALLGPAPTTPQPGIFPQGGQAGVGAAAAADTGVPADTFASRAAAPSEVDVGGPTRLTWLQYGSLKTLRLTDIKHAAQVGQGGFGQVVKVNVDGVQYAVKTLLQEDNDACRREIGNHIACQGVGVVPLAGVVIDDAGEYCGIVTPLAQISLQKYLDHLGRPMKYTEALTVVRQIVRGLATVHAAGRAHLDLKPDNVVLSMRGGKAEVEVIDFGLAADVEDIGNGQDVAFGSHLHGCTPLFAAPEQLEQQQIGTKSDIFALGMICVQLVFGSLPAFAGDILWKNAFLKARPALCTDLLQEWGGHIPAGWYHMMLSCLECDPGDRPSAQQVLDHLDAWQGEMGREGRFLEMPVLAPADSDDMPATARADATGSVAAADVPCDAVLPDAAADVSGASDSSAELLFPGAPAHLHAPAHASGPWDDPQHADMAEHEHAPPIISGGGCGDIYGGAGRSPAPAGAAGLGMLHPVWGVPHAPAPADRVACGHASPAFAAPWQPAHAGQTRFEHVKRIWGVACAFSGDDGSRAWTSLSPSPQTWIVN